MLEQLKKDFEKTIKSLDLTDKKVEIRKKKFKGIYWKRFPK